MLIYWIINVIINPNCGRLYIDSLDWIKNKKVAINTINNAIKYFVIVMLNHEEIKKDPERITKIKSLINKYNWNQIKFPSEIEDWKKLEKNNVEIALNVFCMLKKKKYILFMFQNKLFF